MSLHVRDACRTVFLILVPVLLFGCLETATFERTIRETREHIAGAPVNVETENGSVSILQSDRPDIEIIANVRAVSEERAQATTIGAERDEQGLLSIRAQWPDGRRRDNEGCSFDIAVPDVDGVEIRTSNGRIGTAGLAGEADFHSSNGAISVQRHDGPVTAHTSNGAINLSGVSGRVDAESSNGRIEVINAPGEVRATTSNGRIQIELAPTSPGPVNAKSSNGSVTLQIGPAFAGTLDLQTSNGALRVDEMEGVTFISSGKNRLKLQFGDEEHASMLRTSNGSIALSYGLD